MDSHSIQHIETGNKKILYSIQYTNASLINQSQNVNIVTYEAVEIPDVITVRSSSCEYLNTVTHDANVSDVLFEENNVVNYTTEILHQQKHESDVSELLFEENNDGQYTTEALHQQKPESNVSGLLLENNNVVTYTTEIIQPQKEQNLSVDLFGEMSCSDSDTTVPAKKNKKKKRIKELKAIPLDERKTRGRKLKVPNQTRAQRKKNVNTNKPYINSKGEEVQPKEFDADFICTCPKKCTDNKNLPTKTRKQVFNMFWGVGTFEGRCAFINSCVNEIPKKRCYTKNKDNQKRKKTRKYYLKGVEVCKVTFMKTLQISGSRIDSSLAKTDSEVFTDKRGKKKSSFAFTEERKLLVVNHIKDCYYPQQTLRGMWTHFMESFPDDAVSESFYKRMFYENYNLKFNKINIKNIVKKDTD